MGNGKTYAYKEPNYDWQRKNGLYGNGIMDEGYSDEENEYYDTATSSTVQAEPESPEPVSAEDPEVIKEFKTVNPKLTEVRLKAWIKQSIDRGWEPGMPVPDYYKPVITFNEKGQPVIECPDFRGYFGAFNTASKFLPKNVGAVFWWKHRPSGSMAMYKLDYSSSKAFENLKLHEKAMDVDFELLEKLTGDKEDYNTIQGIKAYSDKLLSEALVRMTAHVQALLYPDQPKKQTGILDADTVKFAQQLDQANTAAQKAQEENAAAQKADADQKTGAMHSWLNVAIEKLKHEIAGPAPDAITVGEYVGSIPGSPLPNIPVEFLYRVSQHLTLGFLQNLATKPEKELDSRLHSFISAPFSLKGMLGYLAGIFEGIWGWIKSTVTLIWDIVSGLVIYTGKAIKYMATDMAADLQKAGEKAGKAFAWMSSHKGEMISFLKDVMSGSGKDMSAISDWLKNKAYQMAEGMGGKVAGMLYDFSGKSDYEKGETIGEIEGYILPDILLAVFSEGIGTVLRESLLAIEEFIELGRAGRVTLEVFKAAKMAYTAVSEFIASAKVFAGNRYSEVRTALREMMESIKEMLGLEEKAVMAVQDVEKLKTETEAVAKLGKKADQTALDEADKTAEKRLEESGEKDAKKAEGEAKILAEAIIVTDVDDADNVPITVVMKELDRLAAENREVKVSFEPEFVVPYPNIWMIGSRLPVKKEYGKNSKSRRKDPVSDTPFESLHGKSLNWIEKQKPKNWRKVPSDDGKGWKWLDENGKERLRFSRPSGENAMKSKWARQENGNFRWQNAAGEHLDVDGKVVLDTDPDFQWKTHIPYEGN